MLRRASLLLALQIPFAVASGQALPWKIDMRQVREPTPNGDCGPIELNVRDATGKTPLTPDGKQIDWQDFDITLTQGEGPLKLISNGRFLCATKADNGNRWAPQIGPASICPRHCDRQLRQ